MTTSGIYSPSGALNVNVVSATPSSGAYGPGGTQNANLTGLLSVTGGLIPGPRINFLGDSEGGLSQFTSYPLPTTWSIPNWAASTAYTAGNTVLNGGFLYQCSTSGTSASSGGPTGAALTAVVDNTAQWLYCPPRAQKFGQNMLLHWVELWSNGAIQWDMNTGYNGLYSGLYRVVVRKGGVNYSPSDSIAFSGGTSGQKTTLNVGPQGVIQSVSIQSPGTCSGMNTGNYSITTSTGTGAQINCILGGTGTFGSLGCFTDDCVAMLPDVVVSGNDIICVLAGTNDVSTNVPYATIVANLKTIYETLINAGIRVVAIPILPRGATMTTLQNMTRQRVNAWIRNYCLKQKAANPSQISSIAIADASGLLTDGTYATSTGGFDFPTGGTTGGATSVTPGDGIHLNPRGACAVGLCVWNCVQDFYNNLVRPARTYTIYNGYDPVYNPSGNILEAPPWIASTAYVVGQQVCNAANIYYCTTPGTSASSGGPTGFSTATDGTITWTYNRGIGISRSQGTSGTLSTAGSVTCSGTFPAGWTLARQSGTAAGTIIGGIETPTWSDGTAGKRGVLNFNLGSGGTTEFWQLGLTTVTTAAAGFTTADQGNAYFYGEAEIELTAVANLLRCSLTIADGTSNMQITAGPSDANNTTYFFPTTAGDVVPFPTKMLIRTSPFLMPTSAQVPAVITNFLVRFGFNFFASGGAGTATATFKMNHVGIFRAYTN